MAPRADGKRQAPIVGCKTNGDRDAKIDPFISVTVLRNKSKISIRNFRSFAREYRPESSFILVNAINCRFTPEEERVHSLYMVFSANNYVIEYNSLNILTYGDGGCKHSVPKQETLPRDAAGIALASHKIRGRTF